MSVLADALATGKTLNGGAQVVYVDNTKLRLMPFAHGYLMIDGIPRRIPEAGVDIPWFQTAFHGFLFIYAGWSGGTFTITNSSAVPARDAVTGNIVCSTDPTLTLIAGRWSHTSYTGYAMLQSITSRMWRSYWVDGPISTLFLLASNVATASASAVGITALCYVALWPDEQAQVWGDATISVNTQNGSAYSIIETTTFTTANPSGSAWGGYENGSAIYTAAIAGAYGHIGSQRWFGGASGYCVLAGRIVGNVTAGTATWHANALTKSGVDVPPRRMWI